MIKFRAWDIKNKKMLSFEDLQDHTVKALNSDVYQIMNNTGYMEKCSTGDSGAEIYDGDILVVSRMHSHQFTHCSVMVCESFYGDGGYMVQLTYDPIGDSGSKIGDRRPLSEVGFFSDVIGNIYENPELLEELDDE